MIDRPAYLLESVVRNGHHALMTALSAAGRALAALLGAAAILLAGCHSPSSWTAHTATTATYPPMPATAVIDGPFPVVRVIDGGPRMAGSHRPTRPRCATPPCGLRIPRNTRPSPARHQGIRDTLHRTGRGTQHRRHLCRIRRRSLLWHQVSMNEGSPQKGVRADLT